MPNLARSSRILAGALGLSLAACASTYTPSQKMKAAQASLGKVEAAAAFARALARSPTATGLCGAPFGFDDPRPAATPEAFSVQAWRAGEEVGRTKENGRTVIHYRKVGYVEQRRFAELKKVRVTREAAGMCKLPVAPGQVALTLHDGRVEAAIVIAVAPGELDATLAAISVLAPQAALIEGMGL